MEMANTRGAKFFKVNRVKGNVTDTIIVIKLSFREIFVLEWKHLNDYLAKPDVRQIDLNFSCKIE